MMEATARIDSIKPMDSAAGPNEITRPANGNSSWMNDELHMFRATVRRFIREELLPKQSGWEVQGSPDRSAWTSAGSAGLLLTDVPEKYGGGGGSFAHEAVIAEELAYAGVHFGFSVQSVVAHYILTYGTEAQKQKWLPRMARGELVGAIAMTEPGAGSDLQAIRTTVRLEGNHYVINGSKTFITNGKLAGLVAVAVKTDPALTGLRSISLIILETKDLAGYKTGLPFDKLGMNSLDTCELFFDELRVPATNLLGSVEGKGFLQMMTQLPYERLLVATSAMATAERAVALTTRYTRDRKVFGKPLIELQNTRFQLAECKTEVRMGRVFLDRCIEGAIHDRLDPVDAAMVKYWVTECEGRILDACLQLHGGYGYVREYPIARMWAGSRIHRIYAGTTEIMKEIIAMSL